MCTFTGGVSGSIGDGFATGLGLEICELYNSTTVLLNNPIPLNYSAWLILLFVCKVKIRLHINCRTHHSTSMVCETNETQSTQPCLPDITCPTNLQQWKCFEGNNAFAYVHHDIMRICIVG